MKKIFTLKNLGKIIKNKNLKKIVFMSGAFDVFHHGHLVALKKASHLGRVLVVQIDGDKLVKKRKGKDRPYIDEDVRANMISSFEFIDFVFISNFPSENRKILQTVDPNIYIRAVLKSESPKIRLEREKAINQKLKNGKVFWLEQSEDISTTKIVNSLNLKRRKFRENFQFI